MLMQIGDYFPSSSDAVAEARENHVTHVLADNVEDNVNSEDGTFGPGTYSEGSFSGSTGRAPEECPSQMAARVYASGVGAGVESMGLDRRALLQPSRSGQGGGLSPGSGETFIPGFMSLLPTMPGRDLESGHAMLAPQFVSDERGILNKTSASTVRITSPVMEQQRPEIASIDSKIGGENGVLPYVTTYAATALESDHANRPMHSDEHMLCLSVRVRVRVRPMHSDELMLCLSAPASDMDVDTDALLPTPPDVSETTVMHSSNPRNRGGSRRSEDHGEKIALCYVADALRKLSCEREAGRTVAGSTVRCRVRGFAAALKKLKLAPELTARIEFNDGDHVYDATVSSAVCETFLGMTTATCKSYLQGFQERDQRANAKTDLMMKFQALEGIFLVDISSTPVSDSRADPLVTLIAYADEGFQLSKSLLEEIKK